MVTGAQSGAQGLGGTHSSWLAWNFPCLALDVPEKLGRALREDGQCPYGMSPFVIRIEW